MGEYCGSLGAPIYGQQESGKCADGNLTLSDQPVEQGSVTFSAAATATAASAALPPCCRIRMPACNPLACLS